MIQVPINYFGKGEDYSLPDDPNIIREFEAKWKEWDSLHPDDPMGEKALAEYKAKNKNTPEAYRGKEATIQEDASDESNRLKLELPVIVIQRLKDYAKYKRKRPRDIIMMWILEKCKA